MAMRNWYSTVDVHGRKNLITFGPQASVGGFTQEIRQRVDGVSRMTAHLHARNTLVGSDEKPLELSIWVPIISGVDVDCHEVGPTIMQSEILQPTGYRITINSSR